MSSEPNDQNPQPANGEPATAARYERGFGLSVIGFVFLGVIDVIMLFTVFSFATSGTRDAGGIGMTFMVFGFPVVVVSALLAAVFIGRGHTLMRQHAAPPRWQTIALVPHLLLLAFALFLLGQ